MRRLHLGLLASVGAALLAVVSIIASGSWPPRAWLERGYFTTQILVLIVTTSAAVLVYLQLSDIRQSLRRGDFDSTSARINRISDLILDHPKVYDELLRNRITTASRALAEAILDVADTELLRRKTMSDLLGAGVPSLQDYFRDLLREVPGLASVLRQRISWYSEDLSALAPETRDAQDDS